MTDQIKSQIIDVVFNNTYERGNIDILDIQEVNAQQYEVQLKWEYMDGPEWYYINLYEMTICRINRNTRERGAIFEIKLP